MTEQKKRDWLQKDVVITWSLRVLGGAILSVLVTAVFVAVKGLWSVRHLLFSSSIMAPSLATTIGPLLSPIVVSSGVLIAILTFARDREKHAREREENRSKILLEQAKLGLDEVYELLKDINNDRVTWVRASRVLLESKCLGEQITTPEYQKAYRLHEDKVRNRLYSSLTIYDPATKKRTPLPPQFFYGINDWDKGISLDDAAKEASAKTNVYRITIDTIPPESGLKQLSTKSIVAVFDFLEFPSNYSDPLNEVKSWGDDWDSHHGPGQGARRYVAHTKMKHAANGKIYPIVSNNEGDPLLL